jgi:hypothetical protein
MKIGVVDHPQGIPWHKGLTTLTSKDAALTLGTIISIWTSHVCVLSIINPKNFQLEVLEISLLSKPTLYDQTPSFSYVISCWTLTSLFTHDDVIRSDLWEAFIIIILACLLFYTKFDMCLRLSVDAFFPVIWTSPDNNYVFPRQFVTFFVCRICNNL